MAERNVENNNNWIPVDKRLPYSYCNVWLSFTNEYCSYVKQAIWDYDKFIWLNGKEVKDKPVA